MPSFFSQAQKRYLKMLGIDTSIMLLKRLLIKLLRSTPYEPLFKRMFDKISYNSSWFGPPPFSRHASSLSYSSCLPLSIWFTEFMFWTDISLSFSSKLYILLRSRDFSFSRNAILSSRRDMYYFLRTLDSFADCLFFSSRLVFAPSVSMGPGGPGFFFWEVCYWP